MSDAGDVEIGAFRKGDRRDNVSASDLGVTPSARASSDSSERTHDESNPELPLRIDRYRVDRILGQGGFGCVYLAFDEQLNRHVAVKVPHPERISQREHVEIYTREARVVAGLDHPHIAPVYDTGNWNEGQCFIVSKFVEGRSLAMKMNEARMAPRDAAQLVATVAGALHHAHGKKLVHRDIKPANIVIDRDNKPHIVDFGIALTESDFGKGTDTAGTPAYMSPEQARGEGHLVDGRSDVFSLGVVFYELLTGERPFSGSDFRELAFRITSVPARPPRQLVDSVPKELERICLKSLEKRSSDRYLTALDMADDLQHFLEAGDSVHIARAPDDLPGSNTLADVQPVRDEPLPRAPSMVPKGLRAFDTDDAEFFVNLLPGPHSRGGLPESLRFWKTLLEELDADKTFRIGLIYGPSGSGKSSFVRAGLLPRLANHVNIAYVECRADDTESRLMAEIQKCDNQQIAPAVGELPLMMRAIRRRGTTSSSGQKLLIVLDQFEQWLQASRGQEARVLIQALRHCDGRHLQCVVIARADFALALERFASELEVVFVRGKNEALVDLFDIVHAKKILIEFGRAYGTISDEAAELSTDQSHFIELALRELSNEDGKVAPVQLALFADMVQGKPWQPETLEQIGGFRGVGRSFLEESFSKPTASPRYRRHANAVQSVLRAMLPTQGNLKGRLVSRDELIQTSEYEEASSNLDDLLQILDRETRLITAIDTADAMSPEEATTDAIGPSAPAYQLTHDYLVPSLQEWLVGERKKTKRGRALIRLQEQSELWNTNRTKRNLPFFGEWMSYLLLTRASDRSELDRNLMRHAARYFVSRLCFVFIAITLFAGGVRWHLGRTRAADRAANLVEQIESVETSQIGTILDELLEYRSLVEQPLRDKLNGAEPSTKWRYRLAVYPWDETQFDTLCEQLLSTGLDEPETFGLLRDRLSRNSPKLTDRLIHLIEKSSEQAERLDQSYLQGETDGADRDELARRRATYAAMLVTLDRPEYSWELLKQSNPCEAAYLIHLFAPLGTDIQVLGDRLASDDNTMLRRRLMLALGEYEVNGIEQPIRDFIAGKARSILQHDPDKGSHAAAKWLLRRWYGAEPVVEKPFTRDREWYTTQNGHTMVILAPAVFSFGSPKRESGRATGSEKLRSERRISRQFAISNAEVTRQQFNAFYEPQTDINPKGEDYWVRLYGEGAETLKQYAPELQCPQTNVNWHLAAMYCNWLSEQDGLPSEQWCFEASGRVLGYFKEMTAKQNYQGLTGYRLPTELEWEYACRAGTDTPRHFGHAASLLENYAWFQMNSDERSHPVRTLKPNEFGLFDTLGNVFEWCMNGTVRDNRLIRVMRGGAFNEPTRYVRAACPAENESSEANSNYGFRVVRTLE